MVPPLRLVVPVEVQRHPPPKRQAEAG
jgi:hypothetical protein